MSKVTITEYAHGSAYENKRAVWSGTHTTDDGRQNVFRVTALPVFGGEKFAAVSLDVMNLAPHGIAPRTEAARDVIAAIRRQGRYGEVPSTWILEKGRVVKEKRKSNPLPDPANLIASAVIQSAARFVTDKVLRGGENPEGVQIMERAENPRGKKPRFVSGDIIVAPWMTRTGKVFHVEWRDGWDNVPGHWAYHIGALGADGEYHTPRWYNESPDMKKVSAARARKRAGNPAGGVLKARYEVEPYRVWRNTRTGARQSVFGAAPLWPDNERELITDGYTIYDTFTGTRGAGRKPFATLAEAETFAAMANQRDAEYKALAKAARAAYDKANMPMVKTGKGRGRAKPKGPAGAILLVLVGHPGGLGYYTGKAWDTEKRKAIRFDSVAGATATAQLLAGKIPQGTKMEVRKV